MIGSVRGTVIERTASGEALVEVGGVGYRVNVPAGAPQWSLQAGNGAALRILNLLQLAVMLLLSIPLIAHLGAAGAAVVTALVTAQGGIGTAAAARLLIPEASTYFAPTLPRALHSSLGKTST